MTTLTDDQAARDYVTEISRTVVAQTAPQELEIFDLMVENYFHDPKPPDFSKRTRDGALASDLGTMIVALTPAATAMASTVLAYLFSEMIKGVGTGVSEAFKVKVRDWLLDQKNTPEMERIKQAAENKAKEYGVPEAKAKEMAEALINTLARDSAGSDERM
jgi:hypothetical protein